MGHVGSKTRSNLRKFLFILLRADLRPDFDYNLVRMFVLTISRPSADMGHVGLKTRSNLRKFLYSL